MPARKPPEPEPDPETALLAAVRRWRLADEAYRATKAEADAARRAVVEAAHTAGLQGFSL